MNDQARDSEPPDEPYLRSAPSVLSPASPKPLQFPQPTNIPVLENMMDVGFNQTEAHMGDPSMHNTGLRPDAWRDPNDQNNTNNTDQASPYSTGGDQSAQTKEVGAEPEVATHSNDTAATEALDPEPIPISDNLSNEADSSLPADAALEPMSTDAAQPTDPSASATEHAEPIPAQSHERAIDPSQSVPDPGAVDVQALLDTLQTSIAPTGEANVAPAAEGLTVATTHSPSHSSIPPAIPGTDASSPLSASGLGAPPSGLPARPPPQELPLINPNYVHSQHIRDYHPHAAHPAVSHNRSSSSGTAVDPNSGGFVPSVAGHQPASAGGAIYQNGQSTNNTNQPTAPTQYPVSNTPIESRREYKIAAGETPTTEDQPWTQDIQRKYDHFMEEERRYVNEAKWDQFPQGSRLFVGMRDKDGNRFSREQLLTESSGNLSSEKVTKRDIFHVFHNYGELAQISIKQAYGFVQFLRAEDCQRALQVEQGRQIRDKRIHLEISKPQKSNNRQQQQTNRRSRSPEQGRRGKQGSNIDRYVGDRNGRGREGYRTGYRSPSPPRYRERYDDRYRRSRSRSPGYGRDRYRGGSPRREADDDLPFPRRYGSEVPEVQVISLDPALNPDFLSWVENAFKSRGLRTGPILRLAPRLSEEAVVRRMIVEGVLAVTKLRRHNQDASKIGLTIFKRNRGNRDVQFEEYDNQEPHICAELVLREKSLQGGPPPQQYGYGAPPPPQTQYGYQQAPPQPPPPFVPPTGYPPGYGQPPAPSPYGAPQQQPPPGRPPLPPNFDPNNLQNLLSTLNQPSPNTPQSANMPYGTPAHGQQPVGYPPQPGQQYGSQQQRGPYAHMRNNSGYGGGHGPTPQPPNQQPPAGSPPVPPNMQDILARLGTYGGQR